ncbi:hypothetical protein [Roseibium polysiphoniae]
MGSEFKIRKNVLVVGEPEPEGRPTSHFSLYMVDDRDGSIHGLVHRGFKSHSGKVYVQDPSFENTVVGQIKLSHETLARPEGHFKLVKIAGNVVISNSVLCGLHEEAPITGLLCKVQSLDFSVTNADFNATDSQSARIICLRPSKEENWPEVNPLGMGCYVNDTLSCIIYGIERQGKRVFAVGVNEVLRELEQANSSLRMANHEDLEWHNESIPKDDPVATAIREYTDIVSRSAEYHFGESVYFGDTADLLQLLDAHDYARRKFSAKKLKTSSDESSSEYSLNELKRVFVGKFPNIRFDRKSAKVFSCHQDDLACKEHIPVFEALEAVDV